MGITGCVPRETIVYSAINSCFYTRIHKNKVFMCRTAMHCACFEMKYSKFSKLLNNKWYFADFQIYIGVISGLV